MQKPEIKISDLNSVDSEQIKKLILNDNKLNNYLINSDELVISKDIKHFCRKEGSMIIAGKYNLTKADSLFVSFYKSTENNRWLLCHIGTAP